MNCGCIKIGHSVCAVVFVMLLLYDEWEILIVWAKSYETGRDRPREREREREGGGGGGEERDRQKQRDRGNM